MARGFVPVMPRPPVVRAGSDTIPVGAPTPLPAATAPQPLAPLGASVSAVPAAPELRYTIPALPEAVHRRKRATAVTPADPTPTASASYRPPVSQREPRTSAASAGEPGRRAVPLRGNAGSPRPTFDNGDTSDGWPPLVNDSSSDEEEDPRASPRHHNGAAASAARVPRPSSSRPHSHEGPEGDGYSYPTGQQAFADYLPAFFGSSHPAHPTATAPAHSGADKRETASTRSTTPSPIAPHPTVPHSRRTAHAYAPAVHLQPAFTSSLPTEFVNPIELLARTGIHLLALTPVTAGQQAVATGLTASTYPGRPALGQPVHFIGAEMIVDNITEEELPVPYVTVGSCGGIHLVSPSILFGHNANEAFWPTSLVPPLPTSAHPYVLAYPNDSAPSPPSPVHFVTVPSTKRKAPSTDRSSESEEASSPPRTHRHKSKSSKHSKHEGKGRRHKRRSHSSFSSPSDSSSSGRGLRTFRDAAGREVVKDSSSTSVKIRQSDALRTLAPATHIARLLRDTGDMLNSYTVANFCRGAVDYFIRQQAEDGPGQRDPSWYSTPAFEKQLWYTQRVSNPAIAMKVIFFI
ncbi:hypothetical protein B484DRAFT_470038 [Ochromonadaceae sp. CCMP2298]|nr:hypothetical protein B484DRAFT_470038 [Ochromonadaceae sp. CCMP2298]